MPLLASNKGHLSIELDRSSLFLSGMTQESVSISRVGRTVTLKSKNMRESSFRTWIIIWVRPIVGASIGAVVSLLYWIHWLACNGRSIGEALKGEVEDATGTLQSVMLLGCLVGVVVGLLFGLGKMKRSWRKEGR